MLARRFPASLRHYATRTVAASKKTPKTAPKPPKPSQSAPVSLRSRLILGNTRNWEKREGVNTPVPEPQTDGMSEEERNMLLVEQLEAQRDLMRSQGRVPPTIVLPLLDHMIPYSVGFKARSEYASARDMWRQFKQNRRNDGKNAFSMRHIAVADSFPGTEIDPALGWFRSMYMYASRVFQAQSLKSTAWIAPMRQEILEQYIELNEAIMKANTRRLEDLTMDSYQDEVLALAAQKKPDTLYRWKFHREATPTRILSLRAGDGEFSKIMPETGSRVAIQALVRFDTEQSIELYDKQGRALHVPAHTAQPQPAKLGKTLHTVPAVPKRVTEYLVADKAFYDPNGRWRFRARFVPEPGRTLAV